MSADRKAGRKRVGPSARRRRVEVVSIDGSRIRVRNLEALGGTPILDVKPVLSRNISERRARMQRFVRSGRNQWRHG